VLARHLLRRGNVAAPTNRRTARRTRDDRVHETVRVRSHDELVCSVPISRATTRRVRALVVRTPCRTRSRTSSRAGGTSCAHLRDDGRTESIPQRGTRRVEHPTRGAARPTRAAARATCRSPRVRSMSVPLVAGAATSYGFDAKRRPAPRGADAGGSLRTPSKMQCDSGT
jgi:hypothetical protein